METTTHLQLVNDTITVVTSGDGISVLLHINQALLNTNGEQVEALLYPQHYHVFDVTVHDISKYHVDNNVNVRQQTLVFKKKYGVILKLGWF